MSGKNEVTYNRRFSEDTLVLSKYIQKPEETYGKVFSKVIDSHRRQKERGGALDFEKLSSLTIPKVISSQDLGLKSNVITFSLSVADSEFLEEEMAYFQDVNRMKLPPRMSWFLGQLVRAYFFQEIQHDNVYIEACPYCRKNSIEQLPLIGDLHPRFCPMCGRRLETKDNS